MSKKGNKKKKRIAEQQRNIKNKKLDEKIQKNNVEKNENSKDKKENKKLKKRINEDKKDIKRRNNKSEKDIVIKNDKTEKNKDKEKLEIENRLEIENELEIKNNKDKNGKHDITKNINKAKSHKKDKVKAKREKEKDEKPKRKLTKKRKVFKRIIWFIFIVLLIILIYLLARPKFKDVTIELGTKEIKVDDFLISQMYKKGSAFVTDLESINLSEVGEKDITLRFLKKEQTVKLKIVDTTAPKVKFKEHTAYLDYKLNPEDFIESKEDLSEMTVYFESEPTISDYGDYPLKVIVSDKYGNKTSGEVKLIITWLLGDVKVELGSQFSVANVVIDVERFGKFVPQEELAKVDTSKLRNL